LRDKRFDPISKYEIPYLRVAVSLLINHEKCLHCLDWIVGVHGIIINFFDGDKTCSATYLPEVSMEQGWSQEQAIKSLIRKAGYNSDITEELLNRISCTRYQSSKYRYTYQDYVRKAKHDPVKESFIREKSKPKEKKWRACLSL